MFLVGVIAAALWGVGWAMKVPRVQRWRMIAALLGLVILAQLVLPGGHPLRLATGGSAAPWLLLGAAVVMILIYRQGLAALRRKTEAREAADDAREALSQDLAPPTLSETELHRYARHIFLREIGGAGQTRLRRARVLVIGAGGLGAPALQYLAAAGVGTLGVVDDDVVDATNLQRQVIHGEATLGQPKVFSAQAAIANLNPHVTVRPYHRKLTEEIAQTLFADYDIVLDGTDNFDARYLANRAAHAVGIPLVSGALSQWEGQVSLFHPAADGPCYECVFPTRPAPELAPSCAEAGVLGPLPGVIGAMMAVETVKQITGAGQVLRGEMLIYDALWGETRKIRLSRRGDCPVCGATA